MLPENLTHLSQKIIELSSITEMDVCVVDSDLIRVTGTGRYSSLINEKAGDNSLYNRVIQNNKKFLLVKPPEDKTCNLCEYLQNCSGLIYLAMPFPIKKYGIAAILLTATKDRYKKELLNNTSLYVRLVDFFQKEIEKESSTDNNLCSIEPYHKSIQGLINLLDKNVMITKNNAILYINKGLRALTGLKQSDNDDEIRNIFNLGNQTVRDKSFVMGAEISGQTRNFCLYPRNLSEASDFKIVFVEQLNSSNAGYFSNFIFNGASARKAVDLARKVSCSDSTVLLEGESGAGKEVFADGIHYESNRHEGELIRVNCAAIPETLWESEFFGYVDGAFTGARKGGKIGKFQAADKGTLFLDEIGEIPVSMQPKLLRVLETKNIIAVGSNKQIDIDVRIIAATNRNLEDMVKQGLFRQDLYYRINVIKIRIPPLRERKEDIIPLANYFIKGLFMKEGGRIIELTPEACELLINYPWPGNIRELKNCIEYSVSITNDTYITPENLPAYITENSNTIPSNLCHNIDSIRNYEYNALRACIGTYGLTEKGKKEIEEILGISRATLYRKLKKYNLK